VGSPCGETRRVPPTRKLAGPTGQLVGELSPTKPRRAPTHRATITRKGGGRARERTLEESKASKRACRPPYPVSPADPRRGRCKRARQRVTRSGLATPGNRRPGLPVRRAFGQAAARGRRNGERGREYLGPCRAVGLVEREPARKQEARESGYGSSRRESSEGRLQGRERHETRPRSVGASRRRRIRKSSCVPCAWPEPSRGARTLRTAPVGAWRPPPTLLRSRDRGGATRGTRRRCARGSKNPREANPGLSGQRSFAHANGRRATEHGQSDQGSALKES